MVMKNLNFDRSKFRLPPCSLPNWPTNLQPTDHPVWATVRVGCLLSQFGGWKQKQNKKGVTKNTTPTSTLLNCNVVYVCTGNARSAPALSSGRAATNLVTAAIMQSEVKDSKVILGQGWARARPYNNGKSKARLGQVGQGHGSKK